MIFWPSTIYSDYPICQNFYFHDLDTELALYQTTSGFHGAIATGVTCQPGALTLPDTWFRLFSGTCLWSSSWDHFSRTYHVFSRLFTLNISRYVLHFVLSGISVESSILDTCTALTDSVAEWIEAQRWKAGGRWLDSRWRDIFIFDFSLATWC